MKFCSAFSGHKFWKLFLFGNLWLSYRNKVQCERESEKITLIYRTEIQILLCMFFCLALPVVNNVEIVRRSREQNQMSLILIPKSSINVTQSLSFSQLF